MLTRLLKRFIPGYYTRAEYEARIAELKLAGWTACCGWYRSIGYHSPEQYKALCVDYDWHRENHVFAHDKPIDGPRPGNPNFSEYLNSARPK